MEHPQATDGILGGQTPPPINSATLGGIAGLQQRLVTATPEQRSHLLNTALSYGEAGIDLVIATLNNAPALTVRATAYQLLQAVDLEKAKAAIANGILLNPGDRVYSVFKSAIQFNDEFFSLDPEYQNLDFLDEINWEGLGYTDYEAFCKSEGKEYSGGEIDSYVPKRVARYLGKAEADATAEQLHQKLVNECEYTGSFEERSDFDLNEWCKANQITDADRYEYLYQLRDKLKGEGNYELLGKLWRDSVGDFAFVHEETVNKPQYLKL